jgi:ribose transport system permease protein
VNAKRLPARAGRLLLGGLEHYSALYVCVLFVIVFAIAVPDTFLTVTTVKAILNQQAVTALIAVGLTAAVAAGAIDLSVAGIFGFAAVVSADLVVKSGMSTGLAVVLTVLVGIGVGVFNAFAVVSLRIDAIIATLGTSSLMAGATTVVSNNEVIIGVPTSFNNIAQSDVGGITSAVLFVVIVSLVLWYVLEHTPMGRALYATGAAPDAAKLSGVRTARITAISLVVAGAVAAFAGVVVTSTLGAGSPTVGPPYLLPAFAAVFLGATQFKLGRVNVRGTLLAVYVLAIGVYGVRLMGAPLYASDFFNGIALILAVGLKQASEDGGLSFALGRRRKARMREPEAVPPAPQEGEVAHHGT